VNLLYKKSSKDRPRGLFLTYNYMSIIEGSPGRGACPFFDKCINSKLQEITKISKNDNKIIGYYCFNCKPKNLTNYTLCRNKNYESI
jgi:hypothetical protein